MQIETPDQTITPQELLHRLEGIKGSKIITVVMETEVKLLKKDQDTKEPCPYENVLKKTRCKIMIGTNYEDGQNRILEKEGLEPNFVAQSHSYADTNHEDKPVIAKHRTRDQWYMNARVTEVYETEYTADGKPVTRDELRRFEPKKKSRPGVQWRMPKVFPECSIEYIKTDGKLIKVQQ
jgi:hypothetical protein